MTLPAENAHVVDTDLTDIELATFCCAYLTGEHMLERAALKAGSAFWFRRLGRRRLRG